MLYIKAFHIISVVAWFAGLFYLPRLFVYHSEAKDSISLERFKIMERRLYYAIIWPAALLTTALGLILISQNPAYYFKSLWMLMKLALVVLLWIYQGLCGYYLKLFELGFNKKTSLFFRMFNEVPTLLLIAIVLLVVIKP